MQVIIRCPDCGKSTLAKYGATPTSEIITNEQKKCTGCGKMLDIHIKIICKLAKPEGVQK